jgi:hypothetical protein
LLFVGSIGSPDGAGPEKSCSPETAGFLYLSFHKKIAAASGIRDYRPLRRLKMVFPGQPHPGRRIFPKGQIYDDRSLLPQKSGVDML